jgi:hypothetical protein
MLVMICLLDNSSGRIMSFPATQLHAWHHLLPHKPVMVVGGHTRELKQLYL